MKFKTEHAVRVLGRTPLCTGCIMDFKGNTDCRMFVEDRKKEGLGSCKEGFIYVEDKS